MIPDGYTEHGCLGGTDLWFRPVLHAQRLQILRAARQIECKTSSRLSAFYSHCMAGQIVAWDMDADIGARPLLRAFLESRGEWDRLLVRILCPGERQSERQDSKRLHRAVLLRRAYPWLDRAGACGYCRSHRYDPITNETAKIEGGLRPPGCATLCELGPAKCPLGHHRDPKVTSERHRMAIEFDSECRASGCWPDDPIVRRNARIISSAITALQHR